MTGPLYPLHESVDLNRRSFLSLTGSLAAAAVWAHRAEGAVRRRFRAADHPFQLGVASGDPTSDGVVLWTRLAPQPLEERGGMPAEPVEVAWQVCSDEQMQKVVRSGKITAMPEWGHSVHVEVEGLEPAREYWYQFKAGSDVSPTGRTRTMPAEGVVADRLRMAFASCQHWESGLFTAYEHMLAEAPDLVIHLGDYIYEYAGKDNLVRKHAGPKLTSLADYRQRHAQYKSDPALQAMHAGAPWLVTWDDHEFENNYANDISEKDGVEPAKFLQQRARAYQAYYEHMPLRKAALPQGAQMQLYRRIPCGGLADFFVLDTRQYRTDQPCGDHNKPPCEAVYDPQATILGTAQRDWLLNGMANSKARWNILAQQVMFARVDRKAGSEVAYSMDQWPGYEMDRRRVLKFLHERQIKNAVVLTGDIHNNWANNLIADFDDLDSQVIASEFVGTSITSGGNGNAEPKYLSALYSENPFVKFHNAERGYVKCDITPQEWRTDYQTVPFVTKPGAPLQTRASFVVEAGVPGVQRA